MYDGRSGASRMPEKRQKQRKEPTFAERLASARTVIALYQDCQQARALLGLLPASAFDRSNIKALLADLGRNLFTEIVHQARPAVSVLDYEALFDAIDFDWSEGLKALQSESDQLARAQELLLRLVSEVESTDMESKCEDLVTAVREQIICLINPATVDQVRRLPKHIQGLGLVHLLDKYKRSSRLSRRRIQEADEWIYAFLEREAKEIQTVLADPNVHTIADLVNWVHEQR